MVNGAVTRITGVLTVHADALDGSLLNFFFVVPALVLARVFVLVDEVRVVACFAFNTQVDMATAL